MKNVDVYCVFVDCFNLGHNTDDGGQAMGEEMRHVQMSRWGKHIGEVSSNNGYEAEGKANLICIYFYVFIFRKQRSPHGLRHFTMSRSFLSLARKSITSLALWC